MEIVTLDSLAVVGFAVRADWSALWVEMPKAWQRLFARRTEIGFASDTFVDVCLEKTPEGYLQLVGARVPSVTQIPRGMTAIEIPKQACIYCRHEGPVTQIAETFGRIYEWAEKNGVRAGDFKVDMGYTPQGGELLHHLYVGLDPATPWRGVRAS